MALQLWAAPLAQAEEVTDKPLAAITQHKGWLNTTRPLVVDDLRGRVILLDFWTYCCINCMQVIPELAKLEATFGDKLAVIGVHSAKFKNEGDNDNIRHAILRYGIHHPVVNDFDFSTWNAFGIHAWPSFVLINADGDIVDTYAGESSLPALTKAIGDVIAQGGDALRHDALPLRAEARLEKQGVLSFPGKITVVADYKGKPALVVADSGHHRVVIMGLDGVVQEVIGSGNEGRADGAFATAQFNKPQGVLVAQGKLYIADTGNHLLRQADLATGQVTTIAGNGTLGRDTHVKKVPALEVGLASPWDVALWPDDKHIVIAMAGLHQLWSYSLEKNTLSVLAGTGEEGLEDGAAAGAKLAQPSGLSGVKDALYFVDAETSSLRVLENGKIRTLIGTGLFDFGDKNGARGVALMQHPLGLAATPEGIYVADAYNHSIRRYDVAHGVLERFAGTGERGNSDGTLSKAQFNEPGGLALGKDVLYVADTNNRSVRTVDLKKKDVWTFSPQEQRVVDKVMLEELLPNEVEVEPLALQHLGTIHLTLGLKNGWHINKDAPSFLALFDLLDHNRPVVSFDRDALLHGKEFLLPPRVGPKYRLQGTFYYCEDAEGSQCLVKSINVPVSYEDPGLKTYSIILN